MAAGRRGYGCFKPDQQRLDRGFFLRLAAEKRKQGDDLTNLAASLSAKGSAAPAFQGPIPVILLLRRGTV